MSKKIKIIILAVVVIVLAGAWYFLNADVNTNKNQVVLEIAETDVQGITFKAFYSQEPVVITKDIESGMWKCGEDIALKKAFKDDIFNAISAIRVTAEIENPDSLSAYGLDPANIVINIKTTKGDYEILVGNYNEIQKNYYIKVGEKVYMAEPESKLNYAFGYDAKIFTEAQSK